MSSRAGPPGEKCQNQFGRLGLTPSERPANTVWIGILADSKALESHQALWRNKMAVLEGLVLEGVPVAPVRHQLIEIDNRGQKTERLLKDRLIPINLNEKRRVNGGPEACPSQDSSDSGREDSGWPWRISLMGAQAFDGGAKFRDVFFRVVVAYHQADGPIRFVPNVKKAHVPKRFCPVLRDSGEDRVALHGLGDFDFGHVFKRGLEMPGKFAGAGRDSAPKIVTEVGEKLGRDKPGLRRQLHFLLMNVFKGGRRG